MGRYWGYIGGIITWFLGRKLNTGTERIIINEKRTKEFRSANHMIFWIKMEIMSLIIILMGIIFMLGSVLDAGISENLFMIISLAFLIAYVYEKYLKPRRMKKNTILLPEGLSTDQTSVLPENEKSNLNSKWNNVKPKKETSRINKKGLTKNEIRKKEFYQELKKVSDKPITFKDTDHSRFIPKKPNKLES